MIHSNKGVLLIALQCFILGSITGYSQSVEVSSFGSPENGRSALLLAVNSRYDTIILNKQPKDWVFKPTTFRNVKNKVFILDTELKLKAEAGAFKKTSDSFWRFEGCENIQIIGNSASIEMNKEEYTDGEWRHGICIRASKDILIQDLTIRDSGGDGIFIAGNGRGTFSENIKIENVCSLNNKRQGISIISAKNVQILNCLFAETKGTLPGAGLDIEPNNPQDIIQNILIENCIFKDNSHSGIMVALGKLTAESNPVSVLIKGCVLRNNHFIDHPKTSTEIIIGSNKYSPVKGEVVFENCLIEESKWGIFYSRKRADAFKVSFIDCAARNICTAGTWPPIFLEVPHYSEKTGPLGGYFFKNLSLEYTTEVPFMVVRGSRMGTLSGLEDVSGDVTIKGSEMSVFKYINYDPKDNKGVSLEVTHRWD